MEHPSVTPDAISTPKATSQRHSEKYASKIVPSYSLRNKPDPGFQFSTQSMEIHWDKPNSAFQEPLFTKFLAVNETLPNFLNKLDMFNMSKQIPLHIHAIYSL